WPKRGRGSSRKRGSARCRNDARAADDGFRGDGRRQARCLVEGRVGDDPAADERGPSVRVARQNAVFIDGSLRALFGNRQKSGGEDRKGLRELVGRRRLRGLSLAGRKTDDVF